MSKRTGGEARKEVQRKFKAKMNSQGLVLCSYWVPLIMKKQVKKFIDDSVKKHFELRGLDYD
jgi:hypothetical protein